MTARSSAFTRLADVHEHMLNGNIDHFLTLCEGHFIVIWWNIGNGRAEILLARGAVLRLAPDQSSLIFRLRCGTVVTIGHEDTCRGAERHWKIRHDTIVRALAAATRTPLGSTLEPQPPGPTGHRPDLATHYSSRVLTASRQGGYSAYAAYDAFTIGVRFIE